MKWRKISEQEVEAVLAKPIMERTERAIMEAECDPVDHDTLRDIAGRIGLADVRAFGLMWMYA